MKNIFEGPRADFSWGHLSIDGIEIEQFGKAVWDANDQVVANPNLLVRITVEAVFRPIAAGSRWKNKALGYPVVVDYLLPDGGLMYLSPEGDGTGYCPRAEDWYLVNEWVSDPEPKP